MFDIFKSKPAANQQSNNQQGNPNNGNPNPNGGQPNASGNPPVQGNALLSGVVDPNGNPNPDTNKSENPLDSFKGLFDNKNNEENKAPVFSLPDEGLTKLASSRNFTSGLPEELMTKALAGDTKSLLEVINLVGQNAYKTSIADTAHLSDSFITARLDHEGKNFSGRVKNELTTAELGSTPGFDHPVVKAQLGNVARELAKLYPDATPQEIAKKSRDYIITMANAINPNSGKEVDSKGNPKTAAEVTNWDDWISNNASLQ